MNNYAWNSKWVLPYESGWSIFEKFKQANVITSRELLKEFGTYLTTRIKGDVVGRRRRNLLSLEGFNHDYVSSVLGLNVYDHTQYYLKKIIGMFSSKSNPSYLIRDILTYCPECLMSGYHSLLHQFQFVRSCPFHLLQLVNKCLSCGQHLYFELSNHNHTGGFLCSCSNGLVNKDYDNSSNWNIQLLIKDKQLIKWLSMDSTMAGRMRNTYFYFPSLVSNLNALEYLIRYHTN